MLLLVVADVEGEGDDLRGDFDGEAREALRSPYPYTSAICISISAVLSLAISVIHFRMPCWEAETKDPEWFY